VRVASVWCSLTTPKHGTKVYIRAHALFIQSNYILWPDGAEIGRRSRGRVLGGGSECCACGRTSVRTHGRRKVAVQRNTCGLNIPPACSLWTCRRMLPGLSPFQSSSVPRVCTVIVIRAHNTHSFCPHLVVFLSMVRLEVRLIGSIGNRDLFAQTQRWRLRRCEFL